MFFDPDRLPVTGLNPEGTPWWVWGQGLAGKEGTLLQLAYSPVPKRFVIKQLGVLPCMRASST